MAPAKEFGARALATFVALASIAACGGSHPESIAIDDESVTFDATDYCRTTTCTPPVGYPQGNECAPPDWAETCAANHEHDVPLWWRTSCVGWSVQKDASRRVTLDEAQAAAGAAFGAWTTAACEGGRPSIAATNMGPVACDHDAYSDQGPNRNAIVFDDAAWPYEDPEHVIALTHVHYLPSTGEIEGATIDVNEATFQVGVHGEPYDLRVVLTHEAGHFFGIGHSSNLASVMYPRDEGGDAMKTKLAPSDVHAICAIYPPNGTRSVSKTVDWSGRVAAGACDTTPRGGFSGTCD